MQTKQVSMNNVTSCNQVESTVLTASICKAWESLKSFQFHKFLPSHIKSVKFTSGTQNEVGSVFDIEYKDGSVWTYRILEISELRHTISYELIAANPSIEFTSKITRIRLYKVTDSNWTYLSWETDFSNDANTHIIQDQKFKKLDYFKDFTKYLSA